MKKKKEKAYFFCILLTDFLIINLKTQSAALKEAIEDLEWPGSSIQIILEPDPPSVTLRAEGHGDLQVCIVFNWNDKMMVASKY